MLGLATKTRSAAWANGRVAVTAILVKQSAVEVSDSEASYRKAFNLFVVAEDRTTERSGYGSGTEAASNAPSWVSLGVRSRLELGFVAQRPSDIRRWFASFVSCALLFAVFALARLGFCAGSSGATTSSPNSSVSLPAPNPRYSATARFRFLGHVFGGGSR
ncbi:hypothetical protein P154DRAFT_346909 [Amniculicola lignicola CBS 123094]|uniref:Uncharacterized protein n=1 Tax=Amniculicola lignicola CBS 123094 TaxID=1392246 RepID=A0A6A5W0R1_9PLEO|nr:hypothetical protein P154DRAFT_346909 [Amniculicola lignicola CBS 123094]